MLEPGAPFHIHFSDIAYANRNETKHLPYGEGTLRAEPLRDALARFERPATVISESPDEESTQAIGAVLGARAARELGEPGLVGRRLVVAAPVAQELRERLDAVALEGMKSTSAITSTASRRSLSASSSRPWAARTRPSAIRVVACETTSCGPTVSRLASARRSASSMRPCSSSTCASWRWLSHSVPRSSSEVRSLIASR